MRMVNLVLALVWLSLGVSLLAVAWLNPGIALPFWNLELNLELAGYVALGLCVFNLVRWRLTRPPPKPQPLWAPTRRRRPDELAETGFKLEDELPPIHLPPDETSHRADKPGGGT